MNINSPITEIKGVGEKTKDSFTKDSSLKAEFHLQNSNNQ